MSSIKPRTTTVVIYQGDDLATLAELRQAAEVASRRAETAAKEPRRGGDEIPNADAERDAYDAFVEEAAERAVIVEVQALGRKAFRDLMGEHTPREVDVKYVDDEGVQRTRKETHPDDAAFEVNVATFPDALLAYRHDGRATIASPEFPTSTARREFLDDALSDGDFERLWTAAYYLNRGMGADPKLSTYSHAGRTSTET